MNKYINLWPRTWEIYARTEQNNDLRVRELPLLDVQDKLGRALRLRLRHGRVGVRAHDVVLPQLPPGLGALRYLERQRVVAEPKVLGGDVPGEERVDAHADAEGHCDHAVRTRRPVQDAHVVAEVVEDREVVLDDQDVPARSVLDVIEHLADHVSGREALLDVEVRARLVEHVHVRRLHGHGRDGEALELPAAEHADVAVEDVGQLARLGGPLEAVPPLLLGSLVLLLQDVADEPTDSAGDVVDVLRLDGRLDVVLEYFGEVVLQVGPAEMDLRRVDESSVLGSLTFALMMVELTRISSQSGGPSYRPRLGFIFPARILRAVDLPMPFVPLRFVFANKQCRLGVSKVGLSQSNSAFII